MLATIICIIVLLQFIIIRNNAFYIYTLLKFSADSTNDYFNIQLL